MSIHHTQIYSKIDIPTKNAKRIGQYTYSEAELYRFLSKFTHRKEALYKGPEGGKNAQLFIKLSAISGVESNYVFIDCNRVKGSFD